jgi:branched-chain amino acid transport system substrate-binding protein
VNRGLRATRNRGKVNDRIGDKLKGPSSFSFALHGYDSMMLLAAAIRQANTTDGPAVRAALEDLKEPVQGLLKTYVKPFSKTQHEALTAKDFVWIKWKDGSLQPYTDDVIKSLQPEDYKY